MGKGTLDDTTAQAAPSTRFERLIALDERMLERLVRVRKKPVTFAFRVLCRIFDPDIMMAAIAIAYTGSTFWHDVGEHAFISMVASSLLVLVVKRAVKRSRPALELQAQAPPDRFSFPSGHSAAVFALAVSMFGVSPLLVPPMLVVAGLVAYARMYLGVHYPLDVGVGSLIGLVTGSVVAAMNLNGLDLQPWLHSVLS